MDNFKTAADKIRAMSNDDLAEFLAQVGYESYRNGLVHGRHFKSQKRIVSYEMMLSAHKMLLNKNAEDVDFGPLPGMGGRETE
jgi:hypothetical protein